MTRKGNAATFGVVVAACCLAGCSPGNVTVSPAFSPPEKIQVAVLDFDWEMPSGQLQGHSMVSSPNAGKYMADAISTHLVSIPGFEVVERSRLNKLLHEKDLQQSDLIKKGEYEEVGRFLGVRFLVLGTVNTYTTWAHGTWHGHTVSFSCRCVDVESGRTVWTLSGYREKGPLGPTDPAISVRELLQESMPELARKIEQARAKQPGTQGETGNRAR